MCRPLWSKVAKQLQRSSRKAGPAECAASDRASHVPRILMAAVLVVFGSLVSFIIYFVLRRREESEFDDRVFLICRERADAIQSLVTSNFRSLESIGGFFSTRIGLMGTTRILMDQSAFLAAGAFSKIFPRISSVAVIERVHVDVREAWEKENGFTIKERTRNATGDLMLVDRPQGSSNGSDLFPLIAFFPTFPATLVDLRGWDLSTSPSHENLLFNTIVAGKPLAGSPKNVLGQSYYGVPLAIPFYDTPAVPETPRQRTEQFRGAIIGVLPLQPIVEAVSYSRHKMPIHLSVWDGSTSGNNLTFVSASSTKGLPAESWLTHEAQSAWFPLSGRRYQLKCIPSQCMKNDAMTARPVIFAVVSGFLFTVPLLMLFAWSVYASLSKALMKARELAIANQQKHEALELMKEARIEAERQSAIKTDFTGYLCHELRNPLHAITAMIDFLLVSCHVPLLSESESPAPHAEAEPSTSLASLARSSSRSRVSLFAQPAPVNRNASFKPLTLHRGVSADDGGSSNGSVGSGGSGAGVGVGGGGVDTDTSLRPLRFRTTSWASDVGYSMDPALLALNPLARASPSNSITSFSRRSTVLKKDEIECLHTIATSVKLMNSIVDDALDMTKIEAGAIMFCTAPFDVRKVIESVVNVEARNVAAKGLQILSHIDPALPAILYGDQGRLQQVLLNLMGNAIKFTEKGHVSLCVSLASTKPYTREQSATMLRASSDHCESWTSSILNPPEVAFQNVAGVLPGLAPTHPRNEDVIELPRPLLSDSVNAAMLPSEHPSHRHCNHVPCHCYNQTYFPSAAERESQGLDGQLRRLLSSPDFDAKSPLLIGNNSAHKPPQDHHELRLPGMDSAPEPEPNQHSNEPESVVMQFTISDTGIGIDPKYVPALFQPYSRAKLAVMKDHVGTGLGLSIVSRIVGILRGSIQVATSLGHGASFRVTIPFATKPPPEPELESKSGSACMSPLLPPAPLPTSPPPQLDRDQDHEHEHEREQEEIKRPPARSERVDKDMTIPPPIRPTHPINFNNIDNIDNHKTEEPNQPPRRHSFSKTSSASYVPIFSTSEHLIHISTPPSPKPQAEWPQPSKETGVELQTLPFPMTRPIRPGAGLSSTPSFQSFRQIHYIRPASHDTFDLPPRAVPAASEQPQLQESSAIAMPFEPPIITTTPTATTTTTTTNNNALARLPPQPTPSLDKPPKEAKVSADFAQFQKDAVILLVDDAPVNLKILARMLRGFTCVTASNGEEAVQAVRQRLQEHQQALAASQEREPSQRKAVAVPEAQFTLIFCDVIMPKMDGVEATKAIRAIERENNLPPTPIAALTAQAMIQDRERCLQAGMDFFIAKPYTRNELITTLNKVYHQRKAKGSSSGRSSCSGGTAKTSTSTSTSARAPLTNKRTDKSKSNDPNNKAPRSLSMGEGLNMV